jgi:malonate-semialdehyde dehydrogenase (acetylating)/methylmalonate-semialdehyde dehydrogenase
MIRHRIGGEETAGQSVRTSPVWDPATGEQQAEVVLAEPADVDAAVRAAGSAFVEWSQASLSRRAKVMFAFRELLNANVEKLARIVSSEHGKVLEDAKGEVLRGLEVVEFACGIPQLLKGEFSDQVSTGIDAYSFRQPLGVCAGITPFNFPAMVPMWMHPVAIACGNAFVLKPSECDPSASNLVAELYAEAGLPAGVFNVVHGDKVAVDALLDHPDVAAISFVGSTPIASYVHRRATEKRKRRTTPWSSPAPISPTPPTSSSPPASVRPGSAAWRSQWRSPSARSPTRWSRRWRGGRGRSRSGPDWT